MNAKYVIISRHDGMDEKARILRCGYVERS